MTAAGLQQVLRTILQNPCIRYSARRCQYRPMDVTLVKSLQAARNVPKEQEIASKQRNGWACIPSACHEPAQRRGVSSCRFHVRRSEEILHD